MDDEDPEEVNGDHEDERVDRGCRQRGLTRGEDTLGAGREGQKNTWAEHKEENCYTEVEHIILLAMI